MKFQDDANYVEIARAYFKSKKVYRYRMKKISDMTDQEVVDKCHAWQEENGMVEDYWSFVNSLKQKENPGDLYE